MKAMEKNILRFQADGGNRARYIKVGTDLDHKHTHTLCMKFHILTFINTATEKM
jgi:hypothetical protein